MYISSIFFTLALFASVFTAENVSILIALLTFIIPLIGLLFKKFKAIISAYNKLNETVARIEKEVKTNGGQSLKDSVIYLKDICARIEKTQKVIEQRSRSSLHCYDYALFEINKDGKLSWANEKFLNITDCTTCDIGGYDWMTIIDEKHRTDFINELNSCLTMCRRFNFDTIVLGKKARFIGHPYKTGENTQEGFLFKLTLEQ